MDTILFIIFAIIAIVCSFNVVLQKHPVSSALSLIGVMGSLAVLYLLLGAEFTSGVFGEVDYTFAPRPSIFGDKVNLSGTQIRIGYHF